MSDACLPRCLLHKTPSRFSHKTCPDGAPHPHLQMLWTYHGPLPKLPPQFSHLADPAEQTQTPKLEATIPWIPAFREVYFQSLAETVNVFFSPSFADYDRRSSGSHDHEESRAMLAQKIEKETVSDKDTALSIGRRRGREHGSPP